MSEVDEALNEIDEKMERLESTIRDLLTCIERLKRGERVRYYMWHKVDQARKLVGWPPIEEGKEES